MSKFLYRHIVRKTGEVFYIGVGTVTDKTFYKGKYSRAFNFHVSCRNKAWNKKFKSIEGDIEVQILKVSDNKDEVYELETLLILYYGRKDLGKGLLLNKTDGKHLNDRNRFRTKEHREKISKTRKKLKIAKGANNPYYGKKHTEDIKEKMRGKRPNSSGKNHPKSKWVLNTMNGIYHENIKEVADCYSLPYSTLRNWLNPKNNVKNKSSFIVA